jgi:hypothetical protein
MRILIPIVALFFTTSLHAADCTLRSPEEFNRFFFRFSTDKSFANQRKIYPLLVQRLTYGVDQGGNEEPRQARFRVTKEQDAAQPALKDYMKKHELTSDLVELRAHYAAVKVFKPDTGWQMMYVFRRKGNCWYMTELQDDSL